VFGTFHEPWFFLGTAEDYDRLAADTGLVIDVCRIDRVVERHTADALWKVFESGAGTAYLSPEHYGAVWTAVYEATARELILAAFEKSVGSDGLVEVIFNRLYLLARKP